MSAPDPTARCPSCGASFAVPDAARRSATCEHCGTSIAAAVLFGASQRRGQVLAGDHAAARVQAEAGRRRMLLVIGTIAVLAIVAGIVATILRLTR
jgi:NAD-dependent SIR2 family protein deacetylase